MALYRIRHKFKRIYIMGVRDIEQGELDNIAACPHVSLASYPSHLPLPKRNTHVHIDGDVLDPEVNPTVSYPVPGGYTMVGLVTLLVAMPGDCLAGVSVSNMGDNTFADLMVLWRACDRRLLSLRD